MSKCQAKDCNREVEQYRYCSYECSVYGEAQRKEDEKNMLKNTTIKNEDRGGCY